MKQHITKEQLGELSQKGKDRLIEIFVQKDLRLIEAIFGKEDKDPDMEYLRNTIDEDRLLLSIGQLIAFLDENTEIKSNVHDGGFIDKWHGWNLFANNHYFVQEELCDVLWEAVKEVLEK